MRDVSEFDRLEIFMRFGPVLNRVKERTVLKEGLNPCEELCQTTELMNDSEIFDVLSGSSEIRSKI
jgi:hypothetical protein